MRIIPLLGIAIALTPLTARADDDGPCFELGGQGIAPCATPGGKVAFESNLVDWQRAGHGADRTDSVTIANSIVRIGLGGNTELRYGITPLVFQHDTGDGWQSGLGDMVVGAKHQFGANGPVALAVQLVLPTGNDVGGQGTWSASAILPVQIPLGQSVNLDVTGEVDAAADSDRHGRHFAWSVVGGADVPLAPRLTMTADIKHVHDDDPAGATDATSVSLAFGQTIGNHAQLTLGGVAGLDDNAPVAEAYVGIGILF